ncbi:MAG TPA: glycosyltransferase family 4 protein [Pyrinomonadaceae bacterium]
MRILHVTSAKHYSGTERHIVDLSRGLAKRGHDVFVALRPTSDWQSKLDFLPPENIFHVSIRNSFGIFSAMQIAEFARDNKIQIVHAHVPRDYIPASIACLAAKPARFVLTRHMLSPLKPFNKFALKNLAMAIGVSEYVGTELRSVFPSRKVTVIPNGLDIENQVEDKALRNEFRSMHDIPFDAPLVGTLGELREAKGQRDFVLAANEVVKRFPDCRFVIAGLDNTFDKSFRRDLKRLVKVLGLEDRFLWLDWLDDTAGFYSALDVFISPSHSESFGLVILEAMIRGTPVVATATRGAHELLGRHAPLVEPKHPVELGSAICDELADDDRGARGEFLRQRAAEKFSLAKMIDETEKVYIEISD